MFIGNPNVSRYGHSAAGGRFPSADLRRHAKPATKPPEAALPGLEPCALHEVSNCSICTGIDKKHQASLEEPEYDRGAAPRIPGGPTIFARFAGTCAGCGRRYEVGAAIHRDTDVWDAGWVGVDCCIQGAIGTRDRGVLK